MTLDLVIAAFVWLLGLCVGSFLNVVIYRLPAGLSLGDPPRSFCPQCRTVIAWYDNIPVLSWWRLGGRCRHCRAPVSLQYPVVEALTGLVFALLYFLLFVRQARGGMGPLSSPQDWPLLLAWLTLAAALLACAGMDIVSYMVDVRVTGVAVAVGVLAYAGWSGGAVLTATADSPLAAAAVAMFLVSLAQLGYGAWREPGGPVAVVEQTTSPQGETDSLEEAERAASAREATQTDAPGGTEQPTTPAEAPPSGPPPAATQAPRGSASLAGRVGVALLLVLTAWILIESGRHGDGARERTRLPAPHQVEPVVTARGRPHAGLAADYVAPVALLAIFTTAVLAAAPRREADHEVRAEIEAERPQARGIALAEAAWLMPSVVAGAAVFVGASYVPAVGAFWEGLAHWSPGAGVYPVAGVTYAMFGAVVGAAAGWALRIIFTLIFGREALGVGDIYILGAAGAAGGWDIALPGLLLAVGLALAGYALGLLLKRTVVIAFGPWLAIGFVAALWLSRPVAAVARQYWDGILTAWTERRDICVIAGGLMLIGSVAAVMLAGLARRWVERERL